jgi:hypothetical protein
MTVQDSTRPVDVNPLVLTSSARGSQRVGAFAIDVILPLLWVAVSAVLFATGVAWLAWLLLVGVVITVAATLASIARTGQSAGHVAAGTRTVLRESGAAAGSSLLLAFVTGKLTTLDVRRGRDPFAPALAPFEFPTPQEAAPVAASFSGSRTPIVMLDSGERLPLESALILGRDPVAPADAPADVHRWPDLSRTLSKSHARIEWDGRLLWATDLASTNGTLLRATGGSQPLLPFQRTPLPADATLELGDRIVTIRATA